VAGHDGAVYVADVDAETDPAASVRAHSGDYLRRRGVRALWLAPLQDEEGPLGALYMESGNAHFLGRGGAEAAELLAGQLAVSLRTAQSRAAVPFIRVLGPIAEWRRRPRGPRATGRADGSRSRPCCSSRSS
jgi:GAF domain-containing protein